MKLKYLIYSVPALLLSLASCNDYLDKMPDTRVELNTVEQLRLLLVSGYPNANYSLLGEFSSDNVIDNNSPSDKGVRYNLPSYNKIDDEIFAWQDAKADSGDDSPTQVWESYYHAIACANAVLAKIPEFEAKGDSAAVAPLKGEALMIRAYSHFILANLFCMPYRGEQLSKSIPGIPYVSSPETVVKVNYERGTLQEDYEKIEKDLLEGLPLINDGSYEVPKYHFNKAASNAFAARFYLFKREYDKVLKYANAAFGGENADASTFMDNIWSQSTLYYLDDFGRYESNMTHSRNFLLLPNYSTFRRHFNGCRYTCNRTAKRGTIQGPGPTWDNWRWSNNATGESFSMNPCFQGQCFTAGEAEYGTYFGANCAEMFEYTDKVAGIGYAHTVRSEFTGEETLMCRAEAKLFLGDINGAIADLKIWENSLRNNPTAKASSTGYKDFTLSLIKNFYAHDIDGFGITLPIHIDEICPSDKYSVTADILPVLQCVQHFRRILTVHTGMRWFDLKRFGIEISHKIGKDQVDKLTMLDPRRALQIPNEVISAGLTPNDRTANTTTATASPSVYSNYQLLSK